MDQIKIGKFIAEQRKKNNLTQFQLAESLGVTDRAVSKWENGRAMPDSSIMLDLCKMLKISVNELLTGELLEVKDYNEQLEKNLLEVVEQKQQADKRLLFVEVIVGVACIMVLLSLCIIAAYVQMAEWLRIVLIIIGFLPILIATPIMMKIEQTAGYYKCAKCGHKYIPQYGRVFMAMHLGRTRYLKCPKCGQRSWNKKVIDKED